MDVSTVFQTVSFPVSLRRLIWAGALAAALGACDKEPVKPKVDQSKPPAAAPSTGQPNSGEARPEPRPTPKPSSGDAELAGKVKAALISDPRVNAIEIDVVAAKGMVTLYGTAPTRASREHAARVASAIKGVKSVENKLAVVAGS